MIQSELRARFASRLSALYSREVPLYAALLRETETVNRLTSQDLERRAPDRVSVERHGAIRVGSSEELAAVSVIFAAMGMHAVGFYDLRSTGVPVVSTAFRPVSGTELELNPFRVFTSMLALDDRTYFTADLAHRAHQFLMHRQLFAPNLMNLARRSIRLHGLPKDEAETFLGLATSAFELSRHPIDRDWYAELSAVSPVAADIAGVPRTHINHLTPRVLDIDLLWSRMVNSGVDMIPEIQGPPRWNGPDLLLRQTSFKALSEPRLFAQKDGTVTPGALRVRFGEVEARGIALTTTGLDRYQLAMRQADLVCVESPSASRQEILRTCWAEAFPHSERELLLAGLGACTVNVVADRSADGIKPTAQLRQLVEHGFVTLTPTVYEDFLPRSAAGIFQSNLDRFERRHLDEVEDLYTSQRMEAILGAPLLQPTTIYAQQYSSSLAEALDRLGCSHELAASPT